MSSGRSTQRIGPRPSNTYRSVGKLPRSVTITGRSDPARARAAAASRWRLTVVESATVTCPGAAPTACWPIRSPTSKGKSTQCSHPRDQLVTPLVVEARHERGSRRSRHAAQRVAEQAVDGLVRDDEVLAERRQWIGGVERGRLGSIHRRVRFQSLARTRLDDLPGHDGKQDRTDRQDRVHGAGSRPTVTTDHHVLDEHDPDEDGPDRKGAQHQSFSTVHVAYPDGHDQRSRLRARSARLPRGQRHAPQGERGLGVGRGLRPGDSVPREDREAEQAELAEAKAWRAKRSTPGSGGSPGRRPTAVGG